MNVLCDQRLVEPDGTLMPGSPMPDGRCCWWAIGGDDGFARCTGVASLTVVWELPDTVIDVAEASYKSLESMSDLCDTHGALLRQEDPHLIRRIRTYTGA